MFLPVPGHSPLSSAKNARSRRSPSAHPQAQTKAADDTLQLRGVGSPPSEWFGLPVAPDRPVDPYVLRNVPHHDIVLTSRRALSPLTLCQSAEGVPQPLRTVFCLPLHPIAEQNCWFDCVGGDGAVDAHRAHTTLMHLLIQDQQDLHHVSCVVLPTEDRWPRF